MTLDDFLSEGKKVEEPTEDYDTRSVQEGTRTDSDIEDIKLPKEAWRYFLSKCEGYLPKHTVIKKLDEEEIRAILDFIDEELDSSRPFAWDEDDKRIENIRENKKEIEKKFL